MGTVDNGTTGAQAHVTDNALNVLIKGQTSGGTTTTIIVNSDGSIIVSDVQFTTKMENLTSGQAQYVGEALPGTAITAASWRIKKIEYDDGETKPPTGIVWASGTASFDKVWNSKTTYTYS